MASCVHAIPASNQLVWCLVLHSSHLSLIPIQPPSSFSYCLGVISIISNTPSFTPFTPTLHHLTLSRWCSCNLFCVVGLI